VSLLRPPRSFPPIRRGSQPSDTHAQKLGVKFGREEAGVTILSVGGTAATPSPHPGALSMLPCVSLAKYPKNAALEQPYTYINIYYI